MAYRGLVVTERRGGSSKSARDAVVLEMEDGRKFVLRIQGGNAFSDPALDSLIGKTIEAEGIVHANVLIMTSWKDAG